jgi:hypothetical protein
MSEDWKASAASGRKEIQIFSKPNPNPAKSGPHSAKPGQIKAKKILGFPSAFSMAYADPRAFFLFAPLPASKEATGRVGAARSPGFQCRFLGLHFEFVLAFSTEVKGWRLFLIADAWALPSDPGGCSRRARENAFHPATGSSCHSSE